MKKICMLLFVFFLLFGVFPITLSSSYQAQDDFASLSGYITDPESNPIANAQVIITCADNVFTCTSNNEGHYQRDDIPIVFCLWNITVEKTGYETSYHEMSIGENSTYDFILTPISTVDLEVEILAGLHFPSPLIRVKNTGEGIAHDVQFSYANITGNVIYNDREFYISDMITPDESQLFSLNSWMIGLGSFTMNLVVSCNEGSFQSGNINGLIFGPFQFIP